MTNTNNIIFLNKIKEKIDNGNFDNYFTLPFMTRELLLLNIKSRIINKINAGEIPVLSDNEISNCLIDIREIAIGIFELYYGLGFINILDNGIELTNTGRYAIKMINKSYK